MNPPRDLDEAAEWLRCSPSWLGKQAARGAVPHSIVAGRVLFSDEQLEAIFVAGVRSLTTAPSRDEVAAKRARVRSAA